MNALEALSGTAWEEDVFITQSTKDGPAHSQHALKRQNRP